MQTSVGSSDMLLAMGAVHQSPKIATHLISNTAILFLVLRTNVPDAKQLASPDRVPESKVFSMWAWTGPPTIVSW